MKILKFYLKRKARTGLLLSLTTVAMSGGSLADHHPSALEVPLEAFASGYASAWSSQDPAALASFYSEDGRLQVNDGEPAVGRSAVAAKARGFMDAFPDMVVSLESVEADGEKAVFHWLWTGTNTGPGGTGRAVRLRGYEEWTFDESGLIRQSLGHYDEAEYRRQVGGAVSEP